MFFSSRLPGFSIDFDAGPQLHCRNNADGCASCVSATLHIDGNFGHFWLDLSLEHMRTVRAGKHHGGFAGFLLRMGNGGAPRPAMSVGLRLE